MFWKKQDIRLNEEYKLIQSIERARRSLYNMQQWRIVDVGELEAQTPRLLAELRYRYLLKQARNKNLINRWYYEK